MMRESVRRGLEGETLTDTKQAHFLAPNVPTYTAIVAHSHTVLATILGPVEIN